MVAIFIPLPSKSTLAQSNSIDQIRLTVNPVTPITSDMTPDEFKFETNYLISTSDVNPYNTSKTVKISEGAIGWGSISGFNVRNVTVFDNLGNSFDPVFKNDSVCNPEAKIDLPPSFEHKISLSFYTDRGITFDSENKEYLLHFVFGYRRAATLTMRFPVNFTVMECDVGTLYTAPPNVSRHEGNQFIVLECDIHEKEPYNLYVKFLPFRAQGITKSFRFTIDLPAVFPTKGLVRSTYEEAFIAPATFSIWRINPFFAIPILFPEYAQNVTVENVWDGIGDCKEISKPVERADNRSTGYYYVDNKNRRVLVYPRHHYKGDSFEYHVGATIGCPPEYKPYKMDAMKERWPPYRYESRITLDNVLVPTYWQLNITGNVEIKFILPIGSQPLTSESGNPTIGLEENRPVARFVYNSPGTLLPCTWQVFYDITSLRNFFWISVISIPVLLGIALMIVVFKLSPNAILVLFGLASSVIFVVIVPYFLILGGFTSSFLLLFAGVLLSFATIIAASIWKLRKKRLFSRALKVVINVFSSNRDR